MMQFPIPKLSKLTSLYPLLLFYYMCDVTSSELVDARICFHVPTWCSSDLCFWAKGEMRLYLVCKSLESLRDATSTSLTDHAARDVLH